MTIIRAKNQFLSTEEGCYIRGGEMVHSHMDLDMESRSQDPLISLLLAVMVLAPALTM